VTSNQSNRRPIPRPEEEGRGEGGVAIPRRERDLQPRKERGSGRLKRAKEREKEGKPVLSREEKRKKDG